MRISRLAVRIAAMPQVVADRELGRLLPDARHARFSGKQRHVGAAQLGHLDDRPHALHGVHDRGEQRSLDLHREVDARRLVARRMQVVDDVDASHECDASVDVTELAMQAAQPVGMEVPRRDVGAVAHEVDASVAQHALQRRREVVARPPSVHENAHRDAALRRAHQRVGDRAPRRVVGEDIALQPYFALRRLDRRDERGKIFSSAAQEPDAIPGREPCDDGAHARYDRRLGTSSKVAASAA
jgi:hypothetical protein